MILVIQYSQFSGITIKIKLEELNWKINELTIASIGVVAMHPSIKLLLVRKEISYFTRNSPNNQKSTIKLCLKLIAFGVSSTLLKFGDKYFGYGEKVIETKIPEIGGYE